MLLRFTMLAIASLTIGWPARGADDEPPDLATARAAYEKEVEFATRPIRDRYFTRLDSLKRSLGSRGDARGAVAVQDEIDRVRAASVEPGNVAKFAGTWKLAFANKATSTFVIRPSGSVTWTENCGAAVQVKGRVQWKENAFILEFDDKQDRLWVLSMNGNTLVVHFFEPKSTYPSGPGVLGKGTSAGAPKP